MRDKYYTRLLQKSQVLDYSEQNQDFYTKFGIRMICTFPFLFHNFESDVRPVDIGFVGTPSPTREKIRDEIIAKFPNLKVQFVMDGSLYDQVEMTKFLCSCKRVLNISYYQNGVLETHRILKAMACGAQVINIGEGSFPGVRFTNDLSVLSEPVIVHKPPDQSYEIERLRWLLPRLSKL
jgi:hypothetical protein